MSGFDFNYGARLHCGTGACGRLPVLTGGAGPVLLITDAGVRRLGLCDTALKAFEAAGRPVIVFDAVEADPSADTVQAAAEVGRQAGADAVIGLGGGSPMDVAKLAAYLLGSGEALDAIYGVDQAKGARLPLVLIPTTAGTGSEATPVAIVTVGGAEKKGVVSQPLYADWAVLDAELTVGLPAHVTAATGVDAMVHAIEAYTSARLKNPLSDLMAEQALRLLAANIRTAVQDGQNRPAREAMLLGAHLAGVAFANAPVAGVHALAYPLGGYFHVPHGLSNALMLPHVLDHNMEGALDHYAELAVMIDPALNAQSRQGRARGLIEALRRIIADCGLPNQLRAVGVSPEHLDLLASEAIKQQRLLINNPVPITEVDARRLYAAAY
jgi:alcohol dehydrogenase class IV